MAGQQWPEATDRQIPVPLAAGGRDDIRAVGQPRPLRAEERIYVEPPGAPEIGRRPLYLGAEQPMPLHRETPVYEDHYRAAPAPRTPNRVGVPVQHRLAKLDTFKGENRERLDDFVYQFEEFATSHAWDQIETCRQARTHLRGVALAYVCRAPLPPRTWQELKNLLTRRFQPRDLTSAYKAQFRAWRRQRNEDIHTYVDVLQKLAEMAWPFLDPLAREEMVVDQFLTGLDNHELRVQVATSDVRRIEDLMRIARSLEAVEGEETGRSHARRNPAQARFAEENEGSESEVARIADQILAKIGPELRQSRDPKRRPPTPGPQRVRSAERTVTTPACKDASTEAKREKVKEKERGRSPSSERSRSCNRDGPPQCYKCKGFGHYMRDCPSNDFYTVGPNGLPVKKRDMSQERQKPKDSPVAYQPLNRARVVSKAPTEAFIA